MTLSRIANFERFEFDGRIYVILRQEGNMAEIQDEDGKKWAWPSVAEVTIHVIEDAFKHPVRKAQ